MKALALLLLVASVVGCVSAETQRALDDAQGRLEAVQAALDGLQRERAEIAARLDAGILTPEDFQTAMESIVLKVKTLDVTSAVAAKEVEALEAKAEAEKEAGWDFWTEIAGATVDLGNSAAIPFAPWLVPIFGALGAAVGTLRKKKEGDE